MKEPCMASSLMMYVKTSPLKSTYNFLRFYDWNRWHCLGKDLKTNFHLFCSWFDISRYRFSRLNSTFRVTANSILCHLSCLLQGFTKGANLRNGWNNNVITPFFKGFKKHSVAINAQKEGVEILALPPLS